MKALILICSLIFLFISCKKGNDSSNLSVYAIQVSPDTIAVGQVVTTEASIRYTSVPINYSWNVTSSNGLKPTLNDTLNGRGIIWIADSIGEYRISLKATSPGYKSYSQSINITVINSDFGYAMWNDDYAKVVSNEEAHHPAILNADPDLVYVKRKNGDILNYQFIQNNLKAGTIAYGEDIINFQTYITDYDQKKDSLSSLYGKPKQDTAIWINTHFKGEPDKWGMAVYDQAVTFQTSWDNGSTKLILCLGSFGNEVKLFSNFFEGQP